MILWVSTLADLCKKGAATSIIQIFFVYEIIKSSQLLNMGLNTKTNLSVLHNHLYAY